MTLTDTHKACQRRISCEKYGWALQNQSPAFEKVKGKGAFKHMTAYRKQNTGYTALADYYDRLMEDVRYDEWAAFYEAVFQKYCAKRPSLVLDLGCGTGRLTCELSGRGYDMIGVDLSEEMLSHAASRAAAEGKNILFLQQDMQNFELYGTVDAILCSLDGINYLKGGEPLRQCFSRVANYLNPGGLFVFDVNTEYKYLKILADQTYTLEAEGVYCVWSNEYNSKSKRCIYDLTIFAEMRDGRYERLEEIQIAYAHSERRLRRMLGETGMEILETVSDFQFSSPHEGDQRHFYICCKPPAPKE